LTRPAYVVDTGQAVALWDESPHWRGQGHKDTGLIHSVETTAANVHDLTPAADLLHGEEEVVYADAGYQGIEKREEMQGTTAKFQVAMRPGKRRALPEYA
jgi:IS5 family transposase